MEHRDRGQRGDQRRAIREHGRHRRYGKALAAWLAHRAPVDTRSKNEMFELKEIVHHDSK